MNDIIQFFGGLFDTSLWPARWHCGSWSDFHGWLYIISDLLIWIAYFLIPIIILNYFNRKKTGLTFKRGYTLFASFILLCGTTHFLDAFTFWVPMYRLNALVLFATAIVSVFTVYYLFKILPVAFAQKTNVELETEIAHRREIERRLEESNIKLHNANTDLEAFAYIASHDLREPLRKIQTYSTILADNTTVVDQQGYIQKIHASAGRLTNMVDALLSLSAFPEKISMQVCDVNKAIAQSLKDIELKIAEKKAIVHVQTLPKIKGNETYLVQLFSNLLGNAIKFSAATPEIYIDAKQAGEYVVLYIRDNGIGMEQEQTRKIFEPFYRLHGRKEYEGFGIGLAICKKIVDIHKGTITAESEPGKGTTFIISLPAAG